MRAGKIGEFRKTILRHWKKNGRHDLPWRKTRDPYKILVSEVMLQQTQVPRVLEKYREFLKSFPTARVLAKAKLSDVLRAWNGLGYNRRGKYLHDAAKEIVRDHKGIVPKDVAILRKLPGMGPYTASAVRIFAFDLPDILIETNIRTAYIHHFFGSTKGKNGGVPLIRDVDIIPIATLAAQEKDPRIWHWALMDYGAHLKKTGVRNNSRSAHYTKQSKFEGSLRQVRGAILRVLHEGPASEPDIQRKLARVLLDSSAEKLREALAGLERNGLIKKEKGKWRIK